MVDLLDREWVFRIQVSKAMCDDLPALDVLAFVEESFARFMSKNGRRPVGEKHWRFIDSADHPETWGPPVDDDYEPIAGADPVDPEMWMVFITSGTVDA